MAGKRYYWLKLQEDFFRQPAMRKLRRTAGGETFTIIYLKMQLLSLKQQGILQFEHFEDEFVKELAYSLEEQEDDVAATVGFLERHGLLEIVETDSYILPETVQNIGSEGESAARMRRSRERKNLETSPSDAEKKTASLGDGKIDEKKAKTSLNDVEKRREEKNRVDKSRGEEEGAGRASPPAPPSVEEVGQYCRENGLRIDARHFVRHFEASNWIDSKGRKVDNWRQKALEWDRHECGESGRERRGSSRVYIEGIDDFDEAEERQKRNRPWDIQSDAGGDGETPTR